MGNDNSPRNSPNKSHPRRIHSNTKLNREDSIPNNENIKIIKKLSKLSKTLSNPKSIINFITKTENIIFLKNMNDSLSIGLNQLNLIIDNDINNPFIENNLKYLQIVDDSKDRKILGKLNYQSKEYNQKQMDNLIKNLIEIQNNAGNNINIDNISRIYNKRNNKVHSREESPNSHKEEELDLTSFSTTIGGKITSNTSNYNKNQNSKQIKTFKLKMKDDFISEAISNTNRNPSSRHDSPYSINSFNTISNVLSSINATHCHSKNSSNISIKEKKLNENSNSSINNSNNNKYILNNNKNNSNNDKYISNCDKNNSNKKINYRHNFIVTEKSPVHNNKNNSINKNINNKIISKKIVKKQLLSKNILSAPQDNKKSPRKKNLTIDINNTDIYNIANSENNSILENNIYINNTISGINDEKIKTGITIKNINFENNNKPKSPISIVNSKKLNYDLEESQKSRIVFNNIRPLTQRNNYSYSNSNSSMINNLNSFNQNSKINNTNIIKEDKFFKYLEQESNSSILKTEPNLEHNSKHLALENKNKKLEQNNKNKNKVDKNNQIKNNKKEVNQAHSNFPQKINKEKYKELNTASILTNNKNLKEKKEVVGNQNIKTINKKIQNNKENNNSNTENNIENKINNTKNIINKNKINIKKINTKTLDNHRILKIVKTNTIKGNISPNKKAQEMKKNIKYLATEPHNSESPNQLESIKSSLEELSSIIKIKSNNNINNKNAIENKTINTNNNLINMNNRNNNINRVQQKKKIIKNTKKKNVKNIIFNIDLTKNNNDEDNKENISNDNQSKSEDISDNSISHDEKIQINNLEKKIGKSFKDKNNIINNKNNNKTKFNKIDINTNYDINKNKYLKNIDTNFEKDLIGLNDNNNNDQITINSIKKNINKNNTRLKKEQNAPKSKINRLVFDLKEFNKDNSSNDNLEDEVCNFSGINNISYTNEKDYNNELFNDVYNNDFQRSKSPNNIFHKKIGFNFNNNNNSNENLKKGEYEYNNDIFENLKIDKIEIEKKTNNNKDDFKNNEIKDIKNSNENSHKNISNTSNDNFSFKCKINKLNDSKSTFSKLDNESNNLKTENIFESIDSNKFNFKINDDIHDSEFNDVDFLE